MCHGCPVRNSSLPRLCATPSLRDEAAAVYASLWSCQATLILFTNKLNHRLSGFDTAEKQSYAAGVCERMSMEAPSGGVLMKANAAQNHKPAKGRLSSTNVHTLAIDIGGTGLKAAVLNAKAEIGTY